MRLKPEEKAKLTTAQKLAYGRGYDDYKHGKDPVNTETLPVVLRRAYIGGYADAEWDDLEDSYNAHYLY